MHAQRQRFALNDFRTTAGKRVARIDAGFETWGTLNADKSNAILICHYFSGNAHAAGKYTEADPLPGWWDAAIGPGKPFDTDRYFVICSDSPLNLTAHDGLTVTTGPASIDPETGQPYGDRFPLLTVTDFVHVQKKLLEHLGIERLVAIAGPSGGSATAIEWSVEYPEAVPRVLAVISPGLYIHPYAAAMMDCWARPILVDPADPPVRGLTEALRLTLLSALSYTVLEEQFGYAPADPEKNPAESLANEFKADAMLGAVAAARAQVIDARHFLYMVRAYKLYDVRARLAAARARYLFIPAESDLIFPPHLSEQAVADLRAAGKEAELLILKGTGGHLDGLNLLGQRTAEIWRFLED